MSEFRLPRIPRGQQIVDKLGQVSELFRQWWQSLAVKIEAQEARQDELIAALQEAVDAIEAAQAAADAANAAAAAADAAAAAAQAEADSAAAAAAAANAAIVTVNTTLADHETRIDALEP